MSASGGLLPSLPQASGQPRVKIYCAPGGEIGPIPRSAEIGPRSAREDRSERPRGWAGSVRVPRSRLSPGTSKGDALVTFLKAESAPLAAAGPEHSRSARDQPRLSRDIRSLSPSRCGTGSRCETAPHLLPSSRGHPRRSREVSSRCAEIRRGTQGAAGALRDARRGAAAAGREGRPAVTSRELGAGPH